MAITPTRGLVWGCQEWTVETMDTAREKSGAWEDRRGAGLQVDRFEWKVFGVDEGRRTGRVAIPPTRGPGVAVSGVVSGDDGCRERRVGLGNTGVGQDFRWTDLTPVFGVDEVGTALSGPQWRG